MTLGNKEYSSHKNKIKKIRTIFEIIVVVALAWLIVEAVFISKEYKPYDPQKTYATNKGFIALSYFGVDRIGNSTLIGVDRLEQHLELLKENGYVTVTGQDVMDYYTKGKPLPERALFLMFEDGRRDTALFSEKLMEKYNFRGTMFTYPDKFEKKDTKFLMPDELKKMLQHGYWEMGTNGYRLHFINVFDRYNRYLGDMDPLLHSQMAPVLGRKYNHYLMDYLRDENDYPIESFLAMKNRLTYDYEKLQEVYTKELGQVPPIYSLMHANTGQFGNSPSVSRVNSYWIHKLFAMNFNREGYSLNNHQSSRYDLTRMQPQAYWPVNHLLMRIKYDINEPIKFEPGNAEKQTAWETQLGASEIAKETIYLTSLPLKEGRMKLKNSEDFKDVRLSVALKGNAFGQQKIYLRADKDLTNYIVVNLSNNNIYVGESLNGQYRQLGQVALSSLDGAPVISVEEDKKQVTEKELEAFIRYSPSKEIAQINAERLKDTRLEAPRTVEQGAEAYVPVTSYHKRATRQLAIRLQGDRLWVEIDNKPALKELPVMLRQGGSLYLGAAWGGYGYSQRNLADDVYDGVFTGLKLEDPANKAVLYDLHYTGWEKIKYRALEIWERILEWALNTF